MIIIFNDTNSTAITAQPYDADFESNLIAGGITHKVVDYDIANEYYWGDYATGGIRSLNDYPLLEELVQEEATNKQILAKYPVHKQLNIISKCLTEAGVPLTAEFIEMRDWINLKATNYNNAIQTYKDNPNVYSFYPKPQIDIED